MENSKDIYDPEEGQRDDTPRTEVPKPAKEEVNDKPAGLTIHWTILVAVTILVIIYFIYFF
ncbi:hypothetical protein BC792_11668 [Sphingobacterium allocomposti]|jgi:hypothetical protein|uniref:Uncharacterized protein n=1 Tax=Sphingobacterium allocomposti TaxID=415956 RepID=A0A5S5DBF2_9SPHI|nr:hypothetical protein [Sphingobacterium composti Yoo et al. 2007 non Ten et al. 2007]TYP92466.1 hypothetical protein BC792_11668 [Sphingobacterium composti Yoo et al. 2007 non Ten et al. 2007]HLS95916.1 hypothetical protein [Sphingobacterium sp.]